MSGPKGDPTLVDTKHMLGTSFLSLSTSHPIPILLKVSVSAQQPQILGLMLIGFQLDGTIGREVLVVFQGFPYILQLLGAIFATSWEIDLRMNPTQRRRQLLGDDI